MAQAQSGQESEQVSVKTLQQYSGQPVPLLLRLLAALLWHDPNVLVAVLMQATWYESTVKR